MDLLNTYPSIPYLEQRARKRIPFFAWEYLASGTGLEHGVAHNLAALQKIKLTPKMLAGRYEPDTRTELFGKTYDVPFGVAPVGMSGLLWPGAERILAAAAKKHNFAYCLSSVACETPETIAGIAGDNGWLQLYPLKDPAAETDLLRRAWEAGIRTLAVTVDIPIDESIPIDVDVPVKLDVPIAIAVEGTELEALTTSLIDGLRAFQEGLGGLTGG